MEVSLQGLNTQLTRLLNNPGFGSGVCALNTKHSHPNCLQHVYTIRFSRSIHRAFSPHQHLLLLRFIVSYCRVRVRTVFTEERMIEDLLDVLSYTNKIAESIVSWCD